MGLGASSCLDLPPCPPGQLRWVTPPPHRASFKKHHFSSFLYVLETSKIRRPLPPTPPEPQPLDPPSRALVRPPTPQAILQKLLFVRVRNVKNTTQVAKFAPSLGPVPTTYPRRHRSPWSLGPRGGPRGLPFFGTAIQPLHPNPLVQPRPLVYRPVHQASSGGYPPTPQGILQKNIIFLPFCTR